MINTYVCDNPDCPGNDLDPHDGTGWMTVNHSVGGDESGMKWHVFCSYDCLSVASGLKPEINPLIAE